MKVIGEVRHKVYICEVSHEEIAKYLNQYYGENPLEKLVVGKVIDLGKGYDFHSDAVRAMRKTEEFIKEHKPVIEAILNGISVAAKTPFVELDDGQ